MLKLNECFLSTLSEHWCIILPFMNRLFFFFRLRTTSRSIKCSLSQHFANIFPVMSWLPKLILLMFQEELTGCWSPWALACLEQFFYRFMLKSLAGYEIHGSHLEFTLEFLELLLFFVYSLEMSDAILNTSITWLILCLLLPVGQPSANIFLGAKQ